ncbi:MAG: hypothetical protein V7K92_16080 [Nostoc sp.]
MSTMVTERLVSISASLRDATRTLDGAAVEPCRTPTQKPASKSVSKSCVGYAYATYIATQIIIF